MKKDTKEDSNCRCHSAEEETIKTLETELSGEKGLLPLSKMFKGLGDPTRLKIIYVLSKSSLCVCDISNLLDISQSAISHQLKVLRDLKLVKFEKQGKLVIYSLDDEHVIQLFNQGLNHVKHR